MLEFWLITGLLIVMVLAFILPALLRPKMSAKTNAINEKRNIFIQQFEEIEQDRMSGALDATQYEIAKSEMERRLLDEMGTTSVSTVSTAQSDRRLAIILAILLPLTSVLLYLKLGNTDAITSSSLATDGHGSAADIEPLLNSLKSKLEKNPNDGAGWGLLARSYVSLGRLDDAVLAYEKAADLIKDDPYLLADYADVLATVNGNSLAGKPEELIDQALKLDPHNDKALMLSATAAYDRKDYKKAISIWENLQKELPADSPFLPSVKAAINDAYNMLGEKMPTTDTQNAAAEPQTAVATTGVNGTVRIAKTLMEKVDPSATLFVYARASQGPPMPIAIVKVAAHDLPYTFHLDDSNAVMPTQKLSQTAEVVLVARISKSGNASPEAGDLQGTSAVVKPGETAVDIEINEVIP